MRKTKLTAKARRALRERMTETERTAEDDAKMMILNGFRASHGLSILTAEAGLTGVA